MIINMTKAAIPTDLRKKKQQHIFIGLFYRGFDWACVSQIEYKIIRKLQLYSTLAKTKTCTTEIQIPKNYTEITCYFDFFVDLN